MKRNKIIVYIFSSVLFTACHDLDLNPLSYGSTETWYSNETEIEMAVNELYKDTFWPLDEDGNTVTVKGSDGTVYVEGTGSYTVTVESYSDSADLSGSSEVTQWSDYQVEKPEALA